MGVLDYLDQDTYESFKRQQQERRKRLAAQPAAVDPAWQAAVRGPIEVSMPPDALQDVSRPAPLTPFQQAARGMPGPSAAPPAIPRPDFIVPNRAQPEIGASVPVAAGRTLESSWRMPQPEVAPERPSKNPWFRPEVPEVPERPLQTALTNMGLNRDGPRSTKEDLWQAANNMNMDTGQVLADIAEPTARAALELGARLGNRAEQQAAASAGQPILPGVSELEQAWQKRAEPFPGFKGGLEMIADPRNFVPAGAIGKVAQTGKVAAGLDELRKITPGATVEAVGKSPVAKNAVSGLPMGSAPEVGGAAVGGLAYQDDPNLSAEENAQRRLAMAVGGAGVGYLGRRLGSKSRLGGTVDDVSGKTPDVGGDPAVSAASRSIPPKVATESTAGRTASQLPPTAQGGEGLSATTTLGRTSAQAAPLSPPSKTVDTTILAQARGFPAKKAGFEQVWNRDRNVLEHQGAAGKELANRMHESREIAETRAGDWISRMPTVRQLGKMEFDNFIDVAEGKAAPKSANVAKASEEWNQIRQEVWATAQNVGLDTGEIKGYFPHRYDSKVFSNVDKWNRALDHLVSSGQAPDRAAAEQMLDKAQEATHTLFGNLEIRREVDLPGFERTKEALYDYLLGSARRISQVSQFGPDNEIGARLITEIGRQGGDTGAAQNILKRHLGTKEYGENVRKISQAIRSYNVLTKMGLSFLSNATQFTNTGTVTGGIRTLTNIPKAAFSKEAKEYALKIGVTIDGVIQDVREGTGWTGIAKYGSPAFNWVEKFQRTLAAVSGRDFAQDMAKRLVKSKGKDAEAERALQAMRLDSASILSRGGKLSEQEKARAARNIVERTQFKVDSQDIPGWVDHPLGRAVAQFRTFAYNQSAFMAREIIEPAIKNRNVKPLITFLLFGLPLGATTTEIQNWVRQRPSEEDPVQRIRQYYQRVGTLGVVGDLLGGLAPPNTRYLPAERYALQAAGTAFGPSMGTFLEGVGTAAVAAQGKPESALRFGIKQLPVVGPTIKNIALPYKPGGRAGAKGNTSAADRYYNTGGQSAADRYYDKGGQSAADRYYNTGGNSAADRYYGK